MPQHIGLIGGIGPAATDFYYRRLITLSADKTVQLEATIVHADAPTLLRNLESSALQAQVEIYRRLTLRLAAAGADCVAVTSIAGHFCINEFREISPLPVIDLIEVVRGVVRDRAYRKLGILGTRSVMESRFYDGLVGTEIVSPRNLVNDVHNAYVSMATSGRATDAQRAVFDSACEWLADREGVDAVLLAGTDMVLVYNESVSQYPLIDCAALHADAIFDHSLHAT